MTPARRKLTSALALATAGAIAARTAMRASPQANHPAELYTGAAQGALFSPFELRIDPMVRLLLINFEQDPDEVYLGFEPQVFDDPIHGQGLIVIAWRVDGYVDVYHQPSVRLDRDTYDIAGKGLADMLERPLDNARFEVSASGVDAHFAFEDKLGRPIAVTIRETGSKARKPFGLLAPMGSAATAPSALPLVFLHEFYFVRQANTEVSIKVAGKERKPDVLPLPLDGSRMYFLRYSSDPLIATLNPAHDGPLAPLERVGSAEARAGAVTYELAANHGQLEIRQLRRAHGRHEVALAFSPPWPNVANLADGARAAGSFTIRADASVGTISGTYHVARSGDSVTLRLTPSGGWRPNEGKWSLKFLYTVAPIFKRWPTTYLWTAEVKLSDGERASMRSSWQRIE